MKDEKQPIDNVTVTNLDMVLKACNIRLRSDLLDRIIDAVSLIEEKGDLVTIEDICLMKKEWINWEALNKKLNE